MGELLWNRIRRISYAGFDIWRASQDYLKEKRYDDQRACKAHLRADGKEDVPSEYDAETESR